MILVIAVNELDFNSRLIRPTGISGLAGGGISPGSRFFMLNNDLLISLSFEEGPWIKGCKYSAISAPPFSALAFNFSIRGKAKY